MGNVRRVGTGDAISQETFDKVRAAYVVANGECRMLESYFDRRYSSCWHRSWLSATDRKRWESVRNRREKAKDRFIALLADAPRDWTTGVPCVWVVESLSYEDAFRPLSEPLSVEPPVSYGHSAAKT